MRVIFPLSRCRNIRRTHKRGQALSVTFTSFTFPFPPRYYYYRFRTTNMNGIPIFL